MWARGPCFQSQERGSVTPGKVTGPTWTGATPLWANLEVKGPSLCPLPGTDTPPPRTGPDTHPYPAAEGRAAGSVACKTSVVHFRYDEGDTHSDRKSRSPPSFPFSTLGSSGPHSSFLNKTPLQWVCNFGSQSRVQVANSKLEVIHYSHYCNELSVTVG